MMNDSDQVVALYLLDTAIEQIEEMMPYVPDYFRDKWGYDEDLLLLKARRNELST